MRVKEVTLYKFNELPTERAKEKARTWWRQCPDGDLFWSESPTEDFKETLKAAGFELNTRHARDELYWSGFSSQGDGACFGGFWHAANVDVQALIADRPLSYTDDKGAQHECKGNARLVPILQAVSTLALIYPTGHGEIVCSDRGHWTRCESVIIDDDSDGSRDEALREALDEIARNLADSFYRDLEAEYDYQNSDEQIDEAMEANGYEFTEDGSIA